MIYLNPATDASLGGSGGASDEKLATQKAIKTYIDSHNYESHTYAELATMKAGSQLVPGCCYRITNFVTTCNSAGGPENVITRSAGHPFDLIVIATSANTFGEDAMAMLHSGDTYFAGCKLSAWDIKYSFENDASLYKWADASGKGVIYFMRDEFLNECAYDFKNIQFKRKWNATTSLHSDLGTDSEGVFAYTFSSEGTSTTTEFTDNSIVGNAKNVYCNIIKEFFNESSGFKCFILNNICYLVSQNCRKNTFKANCFNSTFGKGESNTFGNNCYGNIFGNACYCNTFGQNCYNNTFGRSCYGNRLGQGCNNNTFGQSCNNNTFGQSCNNNTFGQDCYDNQVGSDCIEITMGNSCNYNIFEHRVYGCIFAQNSAGTTPGNYFWCNYIKGGGARFVFGSLILWNSGSGSPTSICAGYNIAPFMNHTLELTRTNYSIGRNWRFYGCQNNSDTAKLVSIMNF